MRAFKFALSPWNVYDVSRTGTLFRRVQLQVCKFFVFLIFPIVHSARNCTIMQGSAADFLSAYSCKRGFLIRKIKKKQMKVIG